MLNCDSSGSEATCFLAQDKIDKARTTNDGKKRKRGSERESQKAREVVHVRAKRGQATDSHSLAERVRREKINEKLKCLQDLVPGCYKTMGMAVKPVMLDVIINYPHISSFIGSCAHFKWDYLYEMEEFLSMKLYATSLSYDFNSTEAVEALQGATGYGSAAWPFN